MTQHQQGSQTLRRICFQGKSSRKRAREATRVSRFSPIDLRELDSIKRNSPHHRRRQWLQCPLSRSTSWCSWAISRWGRRASSPDSCTTSSTTPIRLSPAMKTEPYFLNLFELCLVFIGSSRLGFDPNRLMWDLQRNFGSDVDLGSVSACCSCNWS